MPIFAFPEELRWNEARDAVEFAVLLGEYQGLVIVPRRLIREQFGRPLTPAQAVAHVHLNRGEFERIAEMKLRARELGDDANIHVTGRDIRRLTRGSR